MTLRPKETARHGSASATSDHEDRLPMDPAQLVKALYRARGMTPAYLLRSLGARQMDEQRGLDGWLRDKHNELVNRRGRAHSPGPPAITHASASV